MPQRLPTLGESPYKTILDGFLEVCLNTDGTLKSPVGLSSTLDSFSAIGGQTNVTSFRLNPTAAGSVQQIALYARIDGVAVGGSGAGRLAGVFEAQTGGGSGAGTGNPVWAMNLNVMQNAADTTAQIIGCELQMSSNKADATLDMTPTQVGYSASSGGSKVAGIAVAIGGASKWMEGIQIAQGGIQTGGFAFRYKGNGSSGVVSISEDSKVAIGSTLTVTGASTFTGLATANGGLQIGAGGSFAAGRFYRDGTNGVQFAGVAGSSKEFIWYNAAGTKQLISIASASDTFNFGPNGDGVAIQISTDRDLWFANQTSSAAGNTGTLTNAPAVGNPAFWLRVKINSTNYAIPCWAG